MESNNEVFTKILLIVSGVSATAMLVMGFAFPGSVYMDICGVLCAMSGFFLLGDPDIIGIDGKLKLFRFVALAWALYSAYKVYIKLF